MNDTSYGDMYINNLFFMFQDPTTFPPLQGFRQIMCRKEKKWGEDVK